MKVIPLYCPNCGAPVSSDSKFCSQCGSPIVIDDGVKRSEHIRREIDEARFREVEAVELIRLKELEIQLAKRKANHVPEESKVCAHRRCNSCLLRLCDHI